MKKYNKIIGACVLVSGLGLFTFPTSFVEAADVRGSIRVFANSEARELLFEKEPGKDQVGGQMADNRRGMASLNGIQVELRRADTGEVVDRVLSTADNINIEFKDVKDGVYYLKLPDSFKDEYTFLKYFYSIGNSGYPLLEVEEDIQSQIFKVEGDKVISQSTNKELGNIKYRIVHSPVRIIFKAGKHSFVEETKKDKVISSTGLYHFNGKLDNTGIWYTIFNGPLVLDSLAISPPYASYIPKHYTVNDKAEKLGYHFTNSWKAIDIGDIENDRDKESYETMKKHYPELYTDGKATKILTTEEVRNLGIRSNLTFVAQFYIPYNRIQFLTDLSKGTVNGSDKSEVVKEGLVDFVESDIPTPAAKKGYNFIGWVEDLSNNVVSKDYILEKDPDKRTKTFFAKYETVENSYKVVTKYVDMENNQLDFPITSFYSKGTKFEEFQKNIPDQVEVIKDNTETKLKITKWKLKDTSTELKEEETEEYSADRTITYKYEKEESFLNISEVKPTTNKPENSEGKNGDIRFDGNTGVFYKKENGQWNSVANMKGTLILPTDKKDSKDIDKTVGNPGDLLVNPETGDMFRKTKENEWEKIGNIRGKDGKDGKDGKTISLTNATDIKQFDNEEGNDGDIRLNPTTGDLFEKVNGKWELKGNIKGPAGKDGINGQNGKDGQNGRDGKDGKDGRDGRDGKDGKDGKDGAPAEANVTNVFNYYYGYGSQYSGQQATSNYGVSEQSILPRTGTKSSPFDKIIATLFSIAGIFYVKNNRKKDSIVKNK